jgi:hypothetical protein
LRIREAEAAMRKLSRHLNSLSTQHEEAVAVHDSGKHAAEIVELDTKKFRIAKAASELEIESERLESELEILKERLVDLESQGLEGDETTRREREADDATMCVPVPRAWIDTRANIYLVYDSRSSALSVLISSPMRRAISTERSFAIAARAMFMSSISTQNSPASSTQITFGQRCKDDYYERWFCGRLSSLALFLEAGSRIFLPLLVFLYPWIIFCHESCNYSSCFPAIWQPEYSIFFR